MAERGPLFVNSGLSIPEWELGADFSRAGGPGGQNVNKVETRVQLRFDIVRSGVLTVPQRERLLERLGPRLTKRGEIIVVSAHHRSQERNLEEARERLAELLRRALFVEKTRKASRPTRGSVRRRLDSKRKRSATKSDRRREGDE